MPEEDDSNVDRRGAMVRSLIIRGGAALIGASGTLVNPELGLAGAGLTPVIEDSLTYFAERLTRMRRRQDERVAETIVEAAEDGAADDEEAADRLRRMIDAANSSDEYQELLARALSMARDSAMREKRRALSRALRDAVDIQGDVYAELAFLRDLADIQPVHLRLLQIMKVRPPHLDQVAEQMDQLDNELAVRQWMPWSLIQAAPDLENVIAWPLEDLERMGMIQNRGDIHAPVGVPYGGYHSIQPLWEITPKGEWFLGRLREAD